MKCSRYELIFKQAVKAEDIFLGMGNKNPSTACCEDLLVMHLYVLTLLPNNYNITGKDLPSTDTLQGN